MKLKRPSRPEPCSPHTYVAKKERILDRVREALKVRKWQCADLHKVYPSIRLQAFTALEEGGGLALQHAVRLLRLGGRRDRPVG